LPDTNLTTMAKKQTYNALSKEEIATAVAKKRDDLRNLRFAAAGSKSKNVKEAKVLRKEIARALTALTATKN
jgi:ribosomal protein L29